MKLSCEIVRDLLPLYHDGVCSTESADAVQEHLETCAACREALRVMEADFSVSHNISSENNALKAVGKAWDTARKRSFRRGLRIAGGIFAGIALLVGVFFCFFSAQRMIGTSMEPTVSHGDICFFSRFSEPERFEIAAIRLDWLFEQYGFTDIARIVGVPGDTIEIINGTLYINGEASERFPAGEIEPGDMRYPLVLGEDEYFIMGDLHTNSLDSRYARYGLVDRSNLAGVYIGRLPSWHPFTHIATEAAVPVSEP